LIISMDDSKTASLEQIRAFLAGSGEVQFAGQRREDVYGWVQRTLVQHEYAGLDKPSKGLVRRYLAHLTGLSRSQITRLIEQQVRTGQVNVARYQRRQFPTRYTASDVSLLAYVDRAHGNLSGPATRRILEREFSEYRQAAYERLSAISVAHLYRLRNTQAYRKRNASYQPTRPARVPIGERRKPQPQGEPGFLRIDTVHQGDQPGRKGLFHINAVDEVTQWEVVAATPQISELWLMPVLEAMLEHCWRSCASSRPNHAPTAAATTDWSRPRTAP
jgi:predicted DNA-binding transcriptional regulator AlpA